VRKTEALEGTTIRRVNSAACAPMLTLARQGSGLLECDLRLELVSQTGGLIGRDVGVTVCGYLDGSKFRATRCSTRPDSSTQVTPARER